MEAATQTSPSTNGAGRAETGRPELESFNPATGERIGAVPKLEPGEIQAIVDDVAEVQPFWAQLPLSDRARYMRRTAQVLIDNLEDLTTLLSREQGKSRSESYAMELVPTIDALHWIADNGPRILAPEQIRDVPLFAKTKSHWFSYEPLGVVGVIAPWNYPWSIPFGEVAIALMAGNGVVLKPASLTPLIGERIRWAFERAGLPEGIVRTIHGGGAVGNALVESSAKKIFFTGSVEIGRNVGIACAERMKSCVLELGGKDSAIVLADANIDHAVAGVLWGSFANAGQTCSGIERAYVAREVADRFVAQLVDGARRLRVGDPLHPDTEIGPMVSEDQYEIVCELVDDAVAAGAKLECGGPTEVVGMSGKFYAPAVLTGVTPDMRIMREEIFGPVVTVTTVDSEDEAIALANDSEFGLGNSVWTADRDKGERIAQRLDSGMVWINEHMYTHGLCGCAWGGVKHSGIGRAHSRHGFYECVNVKQVAWDPALVRDMWWHPYDESNARGFHAAAQLLCGRDEDKAGALRRGARPLARLTKKSLRGAFRR